MALLARRIWNWCRRFRHRKGYGVHSPSDFFLITSVIYEDMPFYAYDKLANASSLKEFPHYREKVNRLLFRLVNHFRPSTLVEVGAGNGDAMRYMRAARATMASVSLRGVDKDKMLKRLKSDLSGFKTVDFVHIGHTPYYKEAFEAIFPYLGPHSCVLVGDLYASEEREEWWKQLTEDERIRISFDLYDVGILLFEEKRFKQNYIVNFF